MTHLSNSQKTSSSFIPNTPSTKTDLDFTKAPKGLTPQDSTPRGLIPQDKYKKYKDLIRHPERWKLAMNGADHAFGENGYDQGRVYRLYKDNLIPVPEVKDTSDIEAGMEQYITHKGEPGYMEGMLKAQQYMLDTLGNRMNAEEFVKFHDLAISKIKGFRSEWQGMFGLNFGTWANASIDGLKEWEEKGTSTWQSDKFVSNKIKTSDKQKVVHAGIYGLKTRSNFAVDTVIKGVKDGKFKDYPCFVANFFDNPGDICNKMLNEYYEMMECLKKEKTFPGCKDEAASLEDKKLEIIARICQNLDQAHLFNDGNIRTIVFLLLNKLLIENDLSPTIMEDPNVLDFKSIKEIIEGIKKGQTCFQQTFFPNSDQKASVY